MRHSISIVAAIAALTLLAAPARSETYPERPITFIVPFGAGGGTDVIGRMLQESISKDLGQPIVIDDRPGANGTIGSRYAAKATPDGYTLLLTASSTFSLNPNILKAPQYDQLKDFVPVGFIVRAPWMLVVNTKSGYKSVADVVKAAKEHAGKLTVGYWQSNVEITSEVFQRAAGVKILKIPYKSVVQAVGDLLAQRIDMLFVDIQAVRGYIAAGQLRYLAATTAKRVSLAPDIPTLTESGIPVVTDASVILFAPAKTPKPILERLNATMTKVVNDPANRKKLMDLGHEPTTMTLPELDTFVRSELTRWHDMIEAAGIAKM
ncbi:MAG: tripartite tricarboxylate transporter substrate binding protein [Proteobacteria bacterium]|nr:tripartite tricarboxylate transporter substrate binding protein [Pseudomonadota bacterium]